MTHEASITQALEDYAWIRAHYPEAQVRVFISSELMNPAVSPEGIVFIEWHNAAGYIRREGAAANTRMLCVVLRHARDRMVLDMAEDPPSREPAVAVPSEEP